MNARMTGSKVLWQAMYTLLWIHSTIAMEDTAVMCFPLGTQCAGDSDHVSVSYTECCTGSDPEDTVYRLDSQSVCSACGPVINVSSVVIFDTDVGSVQVVVLQWQLAENSLPATGGYRITQQEEDGIILPLTNDMSSTSRQFVGLRSDLRYTFTITAVLESGARSPPITQIWEGDRVPQFGDFTVISVTEDTVNASWVLEETPGGANLQRMIVRWVPVPGATSAAALQQQPVNPVGLQFPPQNVITTVFEDPVPSGREFSQSFGNLVPGSVYHVRIEGVSSVGISLTLFAFETATTPTTPPPPSSEAIAAIPGASCIEAPVIAIVVLLVMLVVAVI